MQVIMCWETNVIQKTAKFGHKQGFSFYLQKLFALWRIIRFESFPKPKLSTIVGINYVKCIICAVSFLHSNEETAN